MTKGERKGARGPVLVTGGAGYVGSHTVRRLEQAGVPAVVLDDLSAGHRAAVRSPLVVGDLGDRELLRRVFAEHRPGAVVHFAALTAVGESVTDPARYYRENVAKTGVLLEEMRAAGCARVVFSSSCAVYGVPRDLPIPEGHPREPVSPYGRTKLQVEHMLEDFARAYGLRFAALRYFNAAGAARDGSLGEVHAPETHLIPLVLQVAAGRRAEVQIFGDDYDTDDGTCVRDYVHVEDLAEAHWQALERIAGEGEPVVCNLGTGRGHSVREVIDCAEAVTGRAVACRVVARRTGDPARLVSDGRAARERLGWQPERSRLADIVGDAWRFLEGHPGGYGTPS